MSYKSAQVQITKIWHPQEGKKNYNLQDSAGVKYNTFPDDAEKVSEGDWVMIDYEEKEFNGRPFKQTKRLTVTQGGTPMPAAAVQPQKYPPGYGSQPGPRPSNGPPVESVYPSPAEVFVREIVKGAMESGNFGPDDIDKLTKHALGAFNISFRQG